MMATKQRSRVYLETSCTPDLAIEALQRATTGSPTAKIAVSVNLPPDTPITLASRGHLSYATESMLKPRCTRTRPSLPMVTAIPWIYSAFVIPSLIVCLVIHHGGGLQPHTAPRREKQYTAKGKCLTRPYWLHQPGSTGRIVRLSRVQEVISFFFPLLHGLRCPSGESGASKGVGAQRPIHSGHQEGTRWATTKLLFHLRLCFLVQEKGMKRRQVAREWSKF